MAQILFKRDNNTLLAGLIFQQIFIVVSFTSKDFYATVFMVVNKSHVLPDQNQTTEVKDSAHIISTFSLLLCPYPVVGLGASLGYANYTLIFSRAGNDCKLKAKRLRAVTDEHDSVASPSKNCSMYPRPKAWFSYVVRISI